MLLSYFTITLNTIRKVIRISNFVPNIMNYYVIKNFFNSSNIFESSIVNINQTIKIEVFVVPYIDFFELIHFTMTLY